ncbi:MerR family transcriptional regulator [Aureimonas populi]|uniref:MerR family DNA-binding transcriptional regulator n=1 Tax=Aureimonas populi TaxID=1701758 RepID=A0ABW5CIV4_9HYPH|nr:MerR family DNA-binding transcriptional regulator [Aureimonas populi]
MKQATVAQRTDRDDLISEIDRLLGIRTDADHEKEIFKIGDLAREFDMTLRSLRFYEDRGLLNPQRQGTTRLYTRRDRMRLRLILLAKLLGFSLTEAKQMIEIYDQPDGPRRQLQVALERFEEQQTILLEQKREIEQSLKAMETSLALVKRELSKRKG